MSKKSYVLEIVTEIVGDEPKAEMVVDRLIDEGLLVLGYGDTDVDRIVMTFVDCFGTTKTTKQDRYAAHRLAGQHGSLAVCGIIKLLSTNSEQRFAPVVNSITQLEDKWASVMNFVRTIDGEEEVIDA